MSLRYVKTRYILGSKNYGICFTVLHAICNSKKLGQYGSLAKLLIRNRRHDEAGRC